MSLHSRVSRFAARHALWDSRTRVVAAVSGGADSVAMLLVLHDLSRRGGPPLAGVAHLHHGIRGESATADQCFCRALANDLGLAFVTEEVDVPAAAARGRRSIEVAAREVRHAFLERARRALEADRIATAHTADDQAETVLLRLARGTGLRGLGGIAPRTAHRIRPLLSCARRELRDELVRRGQSWREDETNQDLANPRNRIRLELIPYLESHFNPRTTRALCRLADVARADNDVLDQVAEAIGAGESAPAREPDRFDLNGLPAGLARRVVQRALTRLGGARTPSFAAVETVRDVAAGRQSSARVMRRRVEPSGDFVVLVQDGPANDADGPFAFALSIPGRVAHAAQGWIVEAEGPKRRQGDVGAGMPVEPDAIAVDAAEAGEALEVRSRRPGDVLWPLGLGGRKKLQDVLVDRKVPRVVRDRIPIVTDGRGRIVWVAGHVLDARFRVTDRTNAVIILKLRRI